jgi:hypothetical protein
MYDGELRIANIQMMGAAVSAWIEFRKKNDVLAGGVCVASMTNGKKGKTEYKIPVFELRKRSDETKVRCIELDHELQEGYLVKYLAMTQGDVHDAPAITQVQETVPGTLEPPPVDGEDDLLPF